MHFSLYVTGQRYVRASETNWSYINTPQKQQQHVQVLKEKRKWKRKAVSLQSRVVGMMKRSEVIVDDELDACVSPALGETMLEKCRSFLQQI